MDDVEPANEPTVPLVSPEATEAPSDPSTLIVERLAKLEDAVSKLVEKSQEPPPPPQIAEPPPQMLLPPPPAPPPAPMGLAQSRGWRLLAGIRQVGQMYFDPRYRMSRFAYFGVPAVLTALVLNYLFFTWVFTLPFFAPVAERLIIIALAIVLYHILSRELSRYKDVLDYLMRYSK